MQTRAKILTAAIAAAALAGAVASPANAAMSHTRRAHATRHVMHHARMAPAIQPSVATGYGYANRQPGYYGDGFNPVAGIVGAAAGIATAPLAIVTGGAYPYGGYYGEPAYYGGPAPYGYGYAEEGWGWPKSGPYYNTW